MRHVNVAAFVGAVLLGLWLAAAPAEARPPAEFPMLMRLNGEWTRPAQSPAVMPLADAGCCTTDGGGLALWTIDAGVAVANVTGGQVYMVNCSAATNLCLYDGTTTMQASDGGCSNAAGDPNYGLPIPASTNQFIVTQDATTKFFATPTSGGSTTCSIFLLR